MWDVIFRHCRLGICVALLASTSCSKAPERAFKIPSAIEIFNLRKECAKLANEQENSRFPLGVKPENAAVETSSHYDPSTNRCFVEVQTTNVNSGTGGMTEEKTVVDGQSGRVLASTYEVFGKERVAGSYCIRGKCSIDSTILSKAQVDAVIAKYMNDDER